MRELGGGVCRVIPASDQPSLCSDYASLDPLNIKQNNKQVRWGESNARREGF